jgi:uncharacterized cupredoxin-like copper-binding protein
MRRLLLLGLLLALTAACGRGDATGTPREVEVVMGEFFFLSSDTVFEAGVPYRFVLRNEGNMEHEWAVVPRGAEDETHVLTEVEEEDLPPGAEVVHEFTFPEPGEFDFACFLPGHYEGGMVLPVRVVPARR